MARKKHSNISTCSSTLSKSVWSLTDDKGFCITGASTNQNYEPESIAGVLLGLDEHFTSVGFTQGLPDFDLVPTLGLSFRLRSPPANLVYSPHQPEFRNH